ncbi:MAG: winged helix DNA-binding domain-containing protein [Gemmatimonadales bacterium]
MRRLGAAQSQDYLGAKWSIGQRVRNGTDAGLDEAFAAGRILRTHILRPTWHFVTPADIRWMLRLTAPHVLALNGYQHRELELDEAVFERSHALFARALSGGIQLTRAELSGVLRQGGIVAAARRLAYIMMHAELSGLVCSGALKGKQHTYALLEERVPPSPAMSRDAALAELTRRFFAGHAPATLQHYVWWSGLSVASAKAGVAMLGADLPGTLLDGNTWYGVGTRPPTPQPAAARLLPEYDEALVGSADLAVPDLPRARRRGAWRDDWSRPVLVGGRRAGTWRRTVTPRAVVLETNLFASLDRPQSKALDAAAERYGSFLGLPVRLEA